MAETIVPVVHGERRSRYRAAVALHALGAGVTAAALGAALGAVGALLGAPWGAAGAVALAIVATVYTVREAGGVPIPIPDGRRQVPQWWRSFFSPQTAALLYGAGLGPGYLTHLAFGTFVAVSAFALAAGDPIVGAAVCAPFGLARGLSVLVARGARDPEQAVALIDRVEALGAGPLPRTLNGAALAAVALAAIAAAF